MKKNVMMRLASFLLVAVLISTSAISGTYAKYVTRGSADDNARVAAFGVQVSANFDDLFASEYDSLVTTVAEDDDKLSVLSVYGGDLVAPGTEGSLADFTVSGKPEVDVQVTYTADLKLEKWNGYCPIVFTVNGETFSMDRFGTVEALEAAVEAAIVASAEYYNAGDDLGATDTGVAKDLAVSWKWHFMGSTEGGTGPAMQTDAKDTVLGNWILADADPATAASISLDVTCIVTQID